jgi:hypothetical protein
MKVLFQSTLVLLAGVSGVLSHGDDRPMHPREIASRQVGYLYTTLRVHAHVLQLAANRRHVIARNCASQIASFERKRKLARRDLLGKREITTTASALEPHETTIKNTTCVTGMFCSIHSISTSVPKLYANRDYLYSSRSNRRSLLSQ